MAQDYVLQTLRCRLIISVNIIKIDIQRYLEYLVFSFGKNKKKKKRRKKTGYNTYNTGYLYFKGVVGYVF